MLFIFLAACGQPVDPARLPAIPQVDTHSFLPAVQTQLDSLRRRVEEDPLDGEAAAELGIACLAYQEDAAAEVALRRAVSISPGRHDWHFYRGVALARLGRTGEAVEAYRSALAGEPDSPAVATRLALLRIRQGELDHAADYLRRALDADPDYPAAQLALARLDLRAGRHREAIERLERLLRESGPAGELHFTLAEAYRLHGDKARAAAELELFERHRSIPVPDEDPLLARLMSVDATGRPQLHEAQRRLAAGRLDEAAGLLDDVLEIDPANLTAHTGLIGVYAALGRHDRVELQFDRALAAAGPSAPLYRNLGKARLQAYRLSDAEAALTQALALNPDDAESHAWFGALRRRQGEPEAAEPLFARALELDPENRLAHEQLAEMAVSTGRHEAAVAHLQALLARESSRSADQWYELGRAYLATERYDDAISAFEAGLDAAVRFGNDRAEARNRSALRLARLKAAP